MGKLIFSTLVAFTAVLFFSTSVYAAGVSGSFNKKTNSVNANFTGLKGVKSVSYMLYYTGNGVPQGVVGSIKPGKKATSASRKLYLGTCSGRVCIKHKNVKGLKLTATFYTGGKSSTKTINIK